MTATTNHLDATFGIEIECYLPEGATQSQAAAAVAHRLGRPCVVQSYNHNVCASWKVVTDGSLGDYTRGVEFVSPILRGDDGLAQIEIVCRALTDFGCTVSKKCGLHVHVGVGSPDLGFFKNLVKIYSVFEPVIDSIMPASRRASTNMFCRSMTAVSAAAIDRATTFDALQATCTGSSRGERRYFKLNLAAYARHRTVEFRQHSGTVDANKARRWTVLCLRMVAAAKGAAVDFGAGRPQPLNRARLGSKAYLVGQMMLRSEGVTGREVCAALNWPSVSLPQQATICGLQFTTQRTGREVRYFARAAVAAQPSVPVSIAGFAQVIGASDDDRQFMLQRAADLGGPVAWAA